MKNRLLTLAGRLVLLIAILIPLADAAQAQSALVGNLAQASSTNTATFNSFDLAQEFTTGTNAAGYTLTSVELRIKTGMSVSTAPTVKIFSGSANGTEVATLTSPSLTADATDEYAFTASGTVSLNASTKYWVVSDAGGDGEWAMTHIGSVGNNQEGRLDWSIADSAQARSRTPNPMIGAYASLPSYRNASLIIRVNGTVVDNTPPTVSSIKREDPPFSRTFNNQVVWRVTFSEDVTNVNAADFQIDGTDATLRVARLSGSSSEYKVTATGGDLDDLNGTVTLSFAIGQNIEDEAGNELANTTPTEANENTFVIENALLVSNFEQVSTLVTPIASDFSSFDLAQEFTTGDQAEGYALTSVNLPIKTGTSVSTAPTVKIFSGSANGMEVATLNSPALKANATENYPFTTSGTVSLAASTSYWVVSDAGGDGDWIMTKGGGSDNREDSGTLPNWSIADSVQARSRPMTGSYSSHPTLPHRRRSLIIRINGTIVDTIAPTVTSIARQSPFFSPTYNDQVVWRVTFSEDVQNVDGADFSIDGTDATLTVAPVSGSSSQYDVTASGGDLANLNGTVTLSFAAGRDIEDIIGNTLASTTPTESNENTFLIENALLVHNLHQASETQSAFSSLDLAQEFTTGDHAEGYVLTGVNLRIETGTSVSTAPTVKIFSESANGTVVATLNSPALKANATENYPFTASGTVSLDASTSYWVVSDAGGDGEWVMTFGGPGGNDENGASDWSIANEAETRTRLMTGSYTTHANRSLTIRINGTTTPDTAAPTVTSITRQTPSDSLTNADDLTWRVTFSEDMQNVDAADFLIGGADAPLTAAPIPGSETTYDVTASGGDLAELDGIVTLSFATDQNIEDKAENALANTAPTEANDNTYALDNTAPAVTSIARQDPASSPTSAAASVTWRVTFSEAVQNVDSTDFSIAGSNAALTIAEVSGADAQYDVTASGGNLSSVRGTVTLSFASGQNIVDALDHTLDATLPSDAANTYAFDNPAALVSNLRKPDFNASMASNDLAQQFTTGDHADGYNLTSVEIAIIYMSQVSEFPALTVRKDSAKGAVVATLTAPSSLAATPFDNANPYTYTAPANTKLNANTSYWIVQASPNYSGGPAWAYTYDTDENAGAASGWSIADGYESRWNDVVNGGTPDLEFFTYPEVLLIQVNGAPVVETDDTAPTVTSIARSNPVSSPTNADAVTWRVTFSEDVRNVGTADFSIAGTDAPLAVAVVSGDSSKYDVTASGGNLASLNATVTLSFATDHDIEDKAENDLTDAAPTDTNDNSYLIDNAAPTVTSIARSNPASSPTDADAVTWRIAFSEDVQNVNTADFSIAGTDAPLAVAVVSGDSSKYDVTASGGNLASLHGTVTLSFKTDHDIADKAENDLTNTAPTSTNDNSYLIDNAAPTVTSIVRQTPTSSQTNADAVTWRVTFSKDVRNVGPTDFEVSGVAAMLAVAVVAGDSSKYDVTASGTNLASFDGTVTLSFKTDQNIGDKAGNTLTDTAPTGNNHNTFNLDNTSPTVTSITRHTPSSSPTNANALTWRVVFSEDVKNVDMADFEVDGVTAALAVSGSDATYDVTASGNDLASLDGTVTLSFASGQNITDEVGNELTNTTASVTNNNTFDLDNTSPSVTAIVQQTPASSPTNADAVTWRVTFSEAVQNVDPADFEVSGATVTLAAAAVAGAVAQYDVTASGTDLASLDGTVTLSFNTGQNIVDAVGNTLNTALPTNAANTYLIDNTAPTVTISGVPGASSAAFTATFTFSEGATGFALEDITLSNATASAFTGAEGGLVYTALISPVANGQVTIDVAEDVATDEAGNGNTAAQQATSTYTEAVIDDIAPTVTAIERQTPADSLTNADDLTWRVTFSEAVQNVDEADFGVSDATATLTVVGVPGSPSQYDVTASGANLVSLDGTVTLSFATGQDIEDEAENDLVNTTPSATNHNTYALDNTAPTVTIDGVSSTITGAFTATFAFSESVTGFEQGDITLGNAGLSDFTGAEGDLVYTARIAPVASGVVTINVAEGVAADEAGNGNAASPRIASDAALSGSISLSVDIDEIDEADTETTVTVTATLNSIRLLETGVAISVISGSATPEADFGEVDDFAIVIPANTLSQTGAFTLAPVQDATDEPDETVVVTGSTTVERLSVSGVEITLVDDNDPPTVTIALSEAVIGENGGVSTVTASLSHASSEPTTVTISVEPVAPATDDNYVLSSNRLLAIAAGTTSSIGEVTVTGVDNDLNEPDKKVRIRSEAVNELGILEPEDVDLTIQDDDETSVTSVEKEVEVEKEAEEEVELPSEVSLHQNYPNPFNPQTTIRYALPQTGDVRLVVYDMLGREVNVLMDGPQAAGVHTVRFDAGRLPNGAYAYRLIAGDKVLVRTMMLVK